MTDCEKVRYRDRVAALLALAKIYQQDKAGHTERRAYRCPKCKGWHLTSARVRLTDEQVKGALGITDDPEGRTWTHTIRAADEGEL